MMTFIERKPCSKSASQKETRPQRCKCVLVSVWCAIKPQLSAKSRSLKLAASKGRLIQVFIIFFHSLHKPATLVQIHTQHRGKAGPWWRLMAWAQATLAANQVRFPGTALYTRIRSFLFSQMPLRAALVLFVTWTEKTQRYVRSDGNTCVHNGIQCTDITVKQEKLIIKDHKPAVNLSAAAPVSPKGRFSVEGAEVGAQNTLYCSTAKVSS